MMYRWRRSRHGAKTIEAVWIVILAGLTVVLPGAVSRSQSGERLAREERLPELEVRRERYDNPPGIPAPGDPLAPAAAPVVFGPFRHFQVNVDGVGANIAGDAANEPSVAIDPTDPSRIAIGWRQFDTIASNFREAGYAYSNDGGQTWTPGGVLEEGVFRSDPVLDFDASGNFYYNSLFHVGLVIRTDVFKSADGGQTWGAAVNAYGDDKQWMTIDRTGGVGTGHIYCAWQPMENGPDTFNRSTDAGVSFETPVFVSAPGIRFGTVAVGPDGAVYAVGIQTTSSFAIAKSTNARNAIATPSFTVSSVNLNGTLLGATVGSNPLPNPDGLVGQVWVAADHSSGPTSGNVYMLCSVDPPGIDPLDVHFIRSTDGGSSWSDPIRVNTDPAGANSWQWFGTMSVAPTGRIDVVWNDTSNSQDPLQSQLFYAFSDDGGVTWSKIWPVSPTWQSDLGYPGVGPDQQQKIGDYYDMISDADGASVAWSATFNGEQDIFYTRIDQAALPGAPCAKAYPLQVPRDFPSVEAAMDAACAGDVVLLAEGVSGVSGFGGVEAADAAGDVGAYPSLALDIYNTPHVSYYDASNGDLKYGVKIGGVWMLETVDAADDTGLYTSLDLDAQGRPHIAYHDATNGDLKYTTKVDGAWMPPVTVDVPGDVGKYASLAVDANDNVHVSYHDATGGDLKYAVRIGGVWTNETVDAPGIVGLYTSLAVDAQNNPHVSYADVDNSILKYVVKAGGVWTVPETVDADALLNSLALDGQGRPHISYNIGFDLKYATKFDGQWVRETLDTAVDPSPSIGVDGHGNPHVLYHDYVNQRMKYAARRDGIWVVEVLDATSAVGPWPALVLDSQGNPRVSYYDQVNGDLKYASAAVELTSPIGGERWFPDTRETIMWDGAGVVDIMISFDGGGSYTTLVSSVSGGEWGLPCRQR